MWNGVESVHGGEGGDDHNGQEGLVGRFSRVHVTKYNGHGIDRVLRIIDNDIDAERRRFERAHRERDGDQGPRLRFFCGGLKGNVWFRVLRSPCPRLSFGLISPPMPSPAPLPLWVRDAPQRLPVTPRPLYGYNGYFNDSFNLSISGTHHRRPGPAAACGRPDYPSSSSSSSEWRSVGPQRCGNQAGPSAALGRPASSSSSEVEDLRLGVVQNRRSAHLFLQGPSGAGGYGESPNFEARTSSSTKRQTSRPPSSEYDGDVDSPKRKVLRAEKNPVPSPQPLDLQPLPQDGHFEPGQVRRTRLVFERTATASQRGHQVLRPVGAPANHQLQQQSQMAEGNNDMTAHLAALATGLDEIISRLPLIHSPVSERPGNLRRTEDSCVYGNAPGGQKVGKNKYREEDKQAEKQAGKQANDVFDRDVEMQDLSHIVPQSLEPGFWGGAVSVPNSNAPISPQPGFSGWIATAQIPTAGGSPEPGFEDEVTPGPSSSPQLGFSGAIAKNTKKRGDADKMAIFFPPLDPSGEIGPAGRRRRSAPPTVRFGTPSPADGLLADDQNDGQNDGPNDGQQGQGGGPPIPANPENPTAEPNSPPPPVVPVAPIVLPNLVQPLPPVVPQVAPVVPPAPIIQQLRPRQNPRPLRELAGLVLQRPMRLRNGKGVWGA